MMVKLRKEMHFNVILSIIVSPAFQTKLAAYFIKFPRPHCGKAAGADSIMSFANSTTTTR